MRIGRGLGELSLQCLELRLEPGHLRLQPYDLLAQCGIAGCLGGAPTTPAGFVASFHLLDCPLCSSTDSEVWRRGGMITTSPFA